jgi:microcystin-dependent protein
MRIPSSLTVDTNINATSGKIQEGGNNLIPSGTITMYGGSVAPSGWLLCNGSAVSRTTYSALFAVLSTSFGTGDGSTTFNLPDLRGRVPVGLGQGSGLTNRTIGSSGGAETHTLSQNEIPSHTHTLSDPGHRHSSNAGGDFISGGIGTSANVSTGGGSYVLSTQTTSSTTGISINSTGGGASHNNMQPFQVINFIIKI